MPGIYDFTDTWNDAGTVFNAIKCAVTDTASHADSALLNLLVGSVEKHYVGKDGELRLGGNSSLYGDAANVLAQRNGTNPQAFYLYNTYTDALNYERGGVWWSGNTLYFGSTAAGTGTARDVYFQRGGVNKLWFGSNSAITVNNSVYPSSSGSWYIGWTTLRFSAVYTNNLDCDGSTIKMSALPTTDPAVPGQLYRDGSGFVKVSL
ncbi:MAG: hypothetical protein D6706_05635 [Chloroflexi bacterium]|nr:MAG: hypothetical protein D6706_05635 [Chloroflexota bacterium]